MFSFPFFGNLRSHSKDAPPARTNVLRAATTSLLAVILPLAAGACQASTSTSPAPTQRPPPYYGPSSAPPYGQPAAPPYYGAPSLPPSQPLPSQPLPSPPQQSLPGQLNQRPLLAPLVGIPAMQQEVRGILAELVNSLSQHNQSLVRGIPMTFDPTTEVNAFAGCDEQGTPFLAATAGILDAVDAIAQTKATDELFGTQTYDAYCNAVLPQMVKSEKARAALPSGIIPLNLGPDARRWSRSHEIFDEITAFTFGHELAHHYLGHTGCAKGQPMGSGPDPTKVGRLLSVVPLFNQFGETAADSAGTFNALDAGRARRPQYEWSETGGVLLLDYFARIERAAGGGNWLTPIGLLTSFMKTHPNPQARIPVVQAFARGWRAQHPG